MKKLFLVSISCLILFFFGRFKLHEDAVFSSINKKAKNVIACSPGTGNSAKAGTDPFFSFRFDLSEEISNNDNRKAAGELINGVLYLKLETRTGSWYPETHDGKSLQVYAFAEAGKSLQLPGPLIRVPEGTIINAEIHNTIPGSPLVMRGFYSRPGNGSDSVSIASGETYKVQFKTGKAGTYFYWASVIGSLREPYSGLRLPFFADAQLSGAFIVDPPNTKPDPQERIMMINIWNDTLKNEISYDREELSLNGLIWPYTERLTYEKNKPVRWRVINASNQDHPMHLHGFYFTLNSHGNADKDNIYRESERRLGVTELLHPHETLSLTWTPEREGNWLFHCHTLFHIMHGSFLRNLTEMTEEQMNDITRHARDGMGGLIMGISVLPSEKKEEKLPDIKTNERELTLIVQEKKNYYDTLMGKGFILREGNISSDINASIPGPPIILEKGKPVAIKIINHLKEATTIHWHGLEIESYFDGVAGWGNRGKELAPLVMPGDSFVVHMTPPRAGTFIYHTHMHSFQLFEGMYGPFIVTEAKEKYNPIVNKIFLFSQGSPDEGISTFLFLNGKTNTDTMTLKRGVNYRFRIINITPGVPELTVSLLQNNKPVNWRMLARDGADLAPRLQINKLASNQSVSIGQTTDFEFNTAKPGNYLLAAKDYRDSIIVSKILQVH
jgi:manganese oxidase